MANIAKKRKMVAAKKSSSSYRIKLFFALFILFSSVIAVEEEKQKPEWKGTIKKENGATVVKNPKEPVYGENILSLEEELSIGEQEGSDEYVFWEIRSPRSVAIDEKQNIYIFDVKRCQVKVFDINGIYIRTIGRKGQGPGEIEWPWTVLVSNQNEMVVEESMTRRLDFFTLEGKFIKNLSLAQSKIADTDIDSAGNIYGVSIIKEGENIRYELKKFDAKLNYLYSLDSAPYPTTSQELVNPFRGSLRFDITKSDQIITGFPKKYELKIFDSKGKLIRKIIKEYVPLKITKEEIKERTKGRPPLDEISLPQYDPPFLSLMADDEGRIFVRTWEKTEDKKASYYDIFDSEGKYIAKLPIKFLPQVWKKNKLYAVVEDEEGFQFVKRYKVNWNI